MILPIICPFSKPYEVWSMRAATDQEMIDDFRRTGAMYAHTKDKLIAKVGNTYDAAVFIAKVGADTAFGNHVSEALDSDGVYEKWEKAMPRSTPENLKRYKNFYLSYDVDLVNTEINQFGQFISKGQVLFYAGMWPGGEALVTDQPLSTFFCPQVALRNAAVSGKAYDAGRIDLYVIRVATSETKAFFYKRKSMILGHENEVLFAAGVTLALTSSVLVRENFPISNSLAEKKSIPVYVLEIDMI